MSATSGVCLIRVEVQSGGLLLTLITDQHNPAGQTAVQHFNDVEDALVAVREFLTGFRRGGLPSYAG